MAGRLVRELDQLKPWYELSRRRRDGRTLVGVAGGTPEDNIERLANYLDKGERPSDIGWLKPAVEDIKAYYLEAMTAQPGEFDATSLQHQFWHDSNFGAAVLAFYHQFQGAEDDRLKLVARMLAPREAVGSTTGPGEGDSK